MNIWNYIKALFGSKASGNEIYLTNLAKERREKAIELWLSIPEEQFNTNTFVLADQTGTIRSACAIGWLAIKGIDGWASGSTNESGFPIPNLPFWKESRYNPFESSGQYFGLSALDTLACFSFRKNKTAQDVGKQLLDCPIHTKMMIHDKNLI